MRPNALCQHQLVRLPEQHGHHGRNKSERQVGEELLDRFDKELDGLAFRPSYQLQVNPIASPSSGRQCRFTRMELLPQLLEQPVKGSYLPMEVVSDYRGLGDHSRGCIFTDHCIGTSKRWRLGRTKKQGRWLVNLRTFRLLE